MPPTRDEDYAAATAVFNLAAPVYPAVATTARTAGRVRAAVRWARTDGRPVRVISTGHAAATARPMDGAVLVRTALDGGVIVDPVRRVARIPAGTRWAEVVDAAAPHGLAVAHGSSPTVGAVGYLLRGGVSFYGRAVGLAVNSVRAIELVDAAGELRRVDAVTDPELFWALRGGGGGFGVVTAVEVALFACASVHTGAAFWSAAHAGELLGAWRKWAEVAPVEATTAFQVLNLPDVPEIPLELRAGPVVCVDGAVLARTPADRARAARITGDLLGPLRAVAAPIADTWAEAGPEAVPHTHMDPVDPLPMCGDHLLLTELGDAAAAEFLRVTGPGSGSPLISAELRQLGGALAAAPPDAGALGHLDAGFAYLGAGVPDGPAAEAAIAAHCAHVRAALAPWDTGRTAPTFVENFAQPQGHLDAERVRVLDRVRRRVDPRGMFLGDVSPGATALT
ncbi:FAD-binding oxidoreductase [Amycolatopsis sp. NPDC004747]